MTPRNLEPVPDAPDLPNGWRFEDPPPAVTGRAAAHDFTPLLEHPQRWVLVDTKSFKKRAASYQHFAKKTYGGKWMGRNVRNKALTDGQETWRIYLCYWGDEAGK